MSLQFDGKLVPFKNSACPLDPVEVVTLVAKGANRGKKVPKATDGRVRTAKEWTSGFVVHTSSGTVWQRKKTLVQSIRDWAYALYQTNTTRSVSWHNSIDTDASMIQSADSRFQCWHACQVNPFTDSCELIQTSDGSLTEPQLEYFADFMDIWTYHTGIPRIIPWKDGKPYAGILTRALSAYGAGRSICAIYGHRNVWYATDKGELKPYRGPGDPSDLPFLVLAERGYLKLDIEKGEDIEYWKSWQQRLNLPVDGIPGPVTRRALMNHGLAGGMVISRPVDTTLGLPAWIF
jgi:hypothetical protein